MGLLDDLRLQIAWGADESLADVPIDHLAVRPAVAPDAPPPQTPPPARGVPVAVQTATATATALAAAAASPAELRAALEQFDGCDLRSSATHLVFSDGNPESGLVFVGEAPGADEDRSGRAFAGAGGRLLDRMLASIGLDRTACLLTYAIPWRPPGNRPVSEAELAACLPFLLRHLALLRPQRIVALGALPTRVLTGTKQSIGRARGRWVNAVIPGVDAPVPVLPMLHPDQLLERPAQKSDAWADLLLLRRNLHETADPTRTDPAQR